MTHSLNTLHPPTISSHLPLAVNRSLIEAAPAPAKGYRPDMSRLRVIIADDERPARTFLSAILREFEDIELVGEATNGAECVELIEREQPDLALIDLQMPEVDGLGVVRLLRKDRIPLIAFVTAYDEYARLSLRLRLLERHPQPARELHGVVVAPG